MNKSIDLSQRGITLEDFHQLRNALPKELYHTLGFLSGYTGFENFLLDDKRIKGIVDRYVENKWDPVSVDKTERKNDRVSGWMFETKQTEAVFCRLSIKFNEAVVTYRKTPIPENYKEIVGCWEAWLAEGGTSEFATNEFIGSLCDAGFVREAHDLLMNNKKGFVFDGRVKAQLLVLLQWNLVKADEEKLALSLNPYIHFAKEWYAQEFRIYSWHLEQGNVDKAFKWLYEACSTDGQAQKVMLEFMALLRHAFFPLPGIKGQRAEMCIQQFIQVETKYDRPDQPSINLSGMTDEEIAEMCMQWIIQSNTTTDYEPLKNVPGMADDEICCWVFALIQYVLGFRTNT